MPTRLFDRQAELLAYLTSGTAIFGDDCIAGRAPVGFDARLLHLEASWSHKKRLEKIRAVLPHTFALLGAAAEPLVREFAQAYPPDSSGRLDNARQFHRFLAGLWRHKPPALRYLADVAVCEMTCAEVAAGAEDPEGESSRPRAGGQGKGIRRAPGVVLLQCAHDVRPVFEPESGAAIPAARDTLLAIAVPPGANNPQVFEVVPAVFDLLRALDDFADLSGMAATPLLQRLIGELAANGLVEVRR